MGHNKNILFLCQWCKTKNSVSIINSILLLQYALFNSRMVWFFQKLIIIFVFWIIWIVSSSTGFMSWFCLTWARSSLPTKICHQSCPSIYLHTQKWNENLLYTNDIRTCQYRYQSCFANRSFTFCTSTSTVIVHIR